MTAIVTPPPRSVDECVTCGHPTFRPEGHADWCGDIAAFNAGDPQIGPDALRSLYWDEGLSQMAIARGLGVSASTVQKWMAAARIPTRTR
jgi:hypothetical protein